MSGSGEKSESLLTGGPDALKLDPSIKAQLDAIEQSLNSMQLQQAFLKTDFKLLQHLNISGNPLVSLGKGPANLRRATSRATRQVQRTPLVPRGKGPAKPHAASVGDLMSALMGVSVVKQTVDSLKDQATAKLQHDWRKLSTGDKAAVISVTTVIAGGTLAGIFARKDSRKQALELIQGKNIPVPGVEGVSIQISPSGRDKRFLLNLDLAVFLRSLSNK